jgi:hypothetical protein
MGAYVVSLDVKVLLMNRDDLFQKACTQLLRPYHEDQFTLVTLTDPNSKAIICRHAFIDFADTNEGRYFDPNQIRAFTFNYLNGVSVFLNEKHKIMG